MDNVEGLKKYIPENSIDLTVTSPPYDDLRDYNDYKWDFKALAKELYRVTKDGGVVVWVVGDKTENGSETGSSFKQALYFKEIGFNLHDTMIYKKKSYPFPPSNRYYQVSEYMFVLSKKNPKTANLIKINTTRESRKRRNTGTATYRLSNGETKAMDYEIGKDTRVKDNIWEYNVGYMKTTKDKFAYKHPAMFPEQLVKDHILSWSNKGDVVLDPFAGSGTTLKMAELLNRKWVGFEISEEYVNLAYKRVAKLDKNYLNELPEEERPAQQQLF